MTLTVKTPSKVILFGEHAVVDGYSAIAMAIDLKTTGEIKGNFETITIELSDLNEIFEIAPKLIKELDISNFSPSLKYVLCATKYAINYLIEFKGLTSITPFKLKIFSEIPVSCGLGSSASVVVTTINSISNFYGISLKNEEVINMAYSVEKDIQGRASITDTATITLSGMIEIYAGNYKIMPKELSEFIKTCNFLIVNVEERTRKTADLVWEVSEHPQKEELFKKIGTIIEKVKHNRSKEELGKLMVENHEILKKFGISTEKLDLVIEASKKYAHGGKLTGAGGGGSVIILLKNEKEELLKELKKIGVTGTFECKMTNF
ncbi:mevalonate kinase [Methanococcus vannielii SB]|uniref:Mevalonate kinase n=1 Tax=Methanococcus vannielii (strain ATCC 35089 / DSM 1224 / JCM 13029 / OCM 148 / SB) TaxID=406327 RepID=A6UPY0_METVS|nr:mevalonate kinase [Methanococcus vannielii]ABR54552.1 mevalonate kinase [Methanococcus vannielii SB]